MFRKGRVLMALGGALATSVCWANQAVNSPQEANVSFATKTVRQEMREASSPQDYELLARYFRVQERLYKAKADADREQRERALRTIAVPKFPAPADTAKWNEEQHENTAAVSARLAEQYEKQLAASPAVLVAQVDAQRSYTPTQREVLEQISALEKQSKASSK